MGPVDGRVFQGWTRVTCNLQSGKISSCHTACAVFSVPHKVFKVTSLTSPVSGIQYGMGDIAGGASACACLAIDRALPPIVGAYPLFLISSILALCFAPSSLRLRHFIMLT